MNYLPSTSWVVVFAMPFAALLGIVGLFYVLHGTDGDTPPSQIVATQNSVLSLASTIAEKDTDGDGLFDWEEQLWATDPKSKDTDGDATTDKDEIDTDRNPLVAGPDDRLKRDEFATYIASSSNQGGTTSMSASLARNVFSQYLLLSSQKGTLSTENVSTMVAGLISQYGDEVPITQANLSELSIIDSNSPDIIKAYAGSLQSILSKAENVSENEFEVMKRYIQSPDENDRKKLTASAELYGSIADELLALKVPVAIQAEHLKLVNGFREYTFMVNSMLSFQSDPMMTMLSIGRYVEVTTTIETAGAQIKKYIESAEV